MGGRETLPHPYNKLRDVTKRYPPQLKGCTHRGHLYRQKTIKNIVKKSVPRFKATFINLPLKDKYTSTVSVYEVGESDPISHTNVKTVRNIMKKDTPF